MRASSAIGNTIRDVSVADCVDNMSEFEVDPSETTLLQFKKIDRCLRVLENVSA